MRGRNDVVVGCIYLAINAFNAGTVVKDFSLDRPLEFAFFVFSVAMIPLNALFVHRGLDRISQGNRND